MNEADYLRIVNFIDETHRKLARLALDQSVGAAQGKTFSDIVPLDSILLSEALISDLRAMADLRIRRRAKGHGRTCFHSVHGSVN